jgi:hypothetical protein
MSNVSTSIPEGFRNRISNPKIMEILSALPLYGGTTPVGTVPALTTPVVPQQPDPAAVAPTTQGEPPAGGVGDDPVAKLAGDPNALGQLLSQVEQLQKDLKDAQGKVGTYEEEKQKAERAQQTREQQLESDLQQRDAAIQQMDAVIKNMAITNAMLSQKNIKWNSVKQAIAELQPDEYEIDVNLEKGSATVNGLDKAAERIAKQFPWLVASEATPPGNPKTPPTNKPRSSGAPPAPPAADGDKQARRNRLMKRYGVIASGQPIA